MMSRSIYTYDRITCSPRSPTEWHEEHSIPLGAGAVTADDELTFTQPDFAKIDAYLSAAAIALIAEATALNLISR
jgi:hypothetical protein